MSAARTDTEGQARFAQLPVIIRQSVAVLFFKLILLEFAFLSFFLILLLIASFAVASFSLTDTSVVIFIYGILNVIKGFMTIVAVMNWVRHYYEVWPGIVIYKSGLFSRHSSSFKLHNISVMEIEQSLVARVFRYGSIQLQNMFVKEQFYLVDVPHPQKVILMIQTCMEKPTPQAALEEAHETQ